MHTSTARRLLQLNRDFYDSFAAEFSATRRRLQPGIMRALEELRPYSSLLDVGCGDGRVLTASHRSASTIHYVGIDFSQELLRKAPTSSGCDFIYADLTSPGWGWELQSSFEAAVCFSVLHHIPGPIRRLRLLRELNATLRPGARCMISVWQFLQSPRLRRKIVLWEQVGLKQTATDPGDYLLDWRRGGHGLRYVHHFETDELSTLCVHAGFHVDDIFYSDGENGALGLYLLLSTSGLNSRREQEDDSRLTEGEENVTKPCPATSKA